MSKYDVVMKEVEELKKRVLALHTADGPRTPDDFKFVPDGIVSGQRVIFASIGEFLVRRIKVAPLVNQLLVKTSLDRCVVGDVLYLTNAEYPNFDITTQYRVLINGLRTVYWNNGEARTSADLYKYYYRVKM